MPAGLDPSDASDYASIFQEATGNSVGNIRRFPGYDPKDSDYYTDDNRNITADVGVGNEEFDAAYSSKGNLGPAPLTDKPTSSSNARRPRTVAAGYQRYVGARSPSSPKGIQNLGKLTVMFRDGTLYNYYDVTPEEWQKFKGQLSKGPMLNWKPVPGFLLSKPHGPADMSNISESAARTIYKVSREAQWQFRNTRKTTFEKVVRDANGEIKTELVKARDTAPRNIKSKMRAAAKNNATAGRPHKPHKPHRHAR